MITRSTIETLISLTHTHTHIYIYITNYEQTQKMLLPEFLRRLYELTPQQTVDYGPQKMTTKPMR